VSFIAGNESFRSVTFSVMVIEEMILHFNYDKEKSEFVVHLPSTSGNSFLSYLHFSRTVPADMNQKLKTAIPYYRIVSETSIQAYQWCWLQIHWH